jgi:DNA-binding IclR family transcriptional regulator
MQQLSEELGETVHLCILGGAQALVMERVEPSAPFLVVPNIGWTMSLYSTASGKVLLAYSPKEVVSRIIRETKLIKYTASTITDPDELAGSLDKISQQGYAVDMEETVSGVMCIAAPIRDYTNAVVASLSICSPVERCPSVRCPDLIARVKRQADIISANLGYQPTFAEVVRVK